MSLRLKPLTQVLSILSLTVLTNPLFAATSSSTTTAPTVTQLNYQQQQLEQEMLDMQKKMAALEQEEANLKATPSNTQTATAKTTTSKTTTKTSSTSSSTTVVSQPGSQSPTTTTTGKSGITVPYGTHSLANLGGFAVITSPYLHPESAYSGSDLIVNYSSINKDASMLEQRQEFQNAMAALGFGLPSDGGSVLELSGEVEGDMNARGDFTGQNNTDLYVGDAELDMQALVNRWLTAYMNFAYDNSPNDVGSRLDGGIYLDNGFITFGNLNVSQWRATVGQLYVPFGQFNSYLISDPINKTLFRTKGQPIIVGYGVPGNDGLAVSAYTFKGVSNTSGNADMTNPYINQFGADANYQFNLGKVKTALGASYIQNVADSTGMQFPGFDDPEYGTAIVGDGFSTSPATEALQHTVPAIDLRGLLSAGSYTLIGEFDTVTEAFSPTDLSFDGSGAAPKAYHIEGVYSFTPWDKPSTFAIGYDHSYQSLGLAVPEARINATLNMSFWRNTLASLELRHDIAYSEDDTAGGNGAVVTSTPTDESTSNAATLQFQVYF